MSGPQTAAGRALLEALSNLAADLPLEFGDEPLERLDIEATLRIILAIEAEAHERSAGAAPLDVDALFASERFINAVIATFAAPGEQSEFNEHPARGYYRNAPEHFRDVLADRYARLAEGTDR